MKALHILYSGIGGSASVVFSLLNENKRDFLIKQNVLFTGDNLSKDYKKKVNKTKNKYFFIKTKKFYPWLSWSKVFFRIYKEKPNLIFLHNFQLIPCLFYKFFFKTKVINIDHQGTTLMRSKSFLSLVFSLLFFDYYVCVTKIKYYSFKKKFSFFKDKIRYIPNSVDTNFFQKNINIKQNKNFRIGMASRIESGKKLKLIIKTLKHQNLKTLNIIFSIAGDGNNLAKLKNYVRDENLQNKVKFEGFINEKKLKLWYKKLDLYVQATIGEGMSISIFEAMSMGVPVIGSNVDGIKNLLGKKQYVGMLFNNTTQDLSKKIKYFYKLSYKSKKLFSKTQRQFVINNYSSTIMFNNYKKIILKTFPKFII